MCRFSGSADALREEVVQSAWYEAFRADMRSSAVVRAVESSLGRVGAATAWTTTRLASASSSLTCAWQSPCSADCSLAHPVLRCAELLHMPCASLHVQVWYA